MGEVTKLRELAEDEKQDPHRLPEVLHAPRLTPPPARVIRRVLSGGWRVAPCFNNVGSASRAHPATAIRQDAGALVLSVSGGRALLARRTRKGRPGVILLALASARLRRRAHYRRITAPTRRSPSGLITSSAIRTNQRQRGNFFARWTPRAPSATSGAPGARRSNGRRRWHRCHAQ